MCKFDERLEAFKLPGQRISIPSIEIILPTRLSSPALARIHMYGVNKKARLGLRLIEQWKGGFMGG